MAVSQILNEKTTASASAWKEEEQRTNIMDTIVAFMPLTHLT